MSNLTDLLPAGAGGKQVDFVASGTIGNGVTVGLNSDGTVEAVAIQPQSAGSPVVFENADTNSIVSTYDSSSNKVIVAYRDNGNSGYGTAIVGTVSGTSISFGSPVVFESATSEYLSATYDSTNDKTVIIYSDQGNSEYGTAIVGTVSGTSISFGSATIFESATTQEIACSYDINAAKILISYRDGGNSSYGTAIVGTVSGTSISFGSAAVFESADNSTIYHLTYDTSTNKIVIAYTDGGNSFYGTAIVGTVSGTSYYLLALPQFLESAATVVDSSATYDSVI
jgi:hypothetical protein